MATRPYRTRVIILLLALVAVTQFPIFASVYFATRGNALEQAGNRLDIGSRIFTSLLASRDAQLRNAVGLVAADFGFREAVATGDDATVQSVLYNHGGRARASFALMLDLNGDITSSTIEEVEDGEKLPFKSLFMRADPSGVVSGVAAADNEPFQIVLVPVMAPQRIGWVGMGFIMDATLAAEFRTLTELEVSFAVNDAVDGVHIYSTLPENEQSALRSVLMKSTGLSESRIKLVADEYMSRSVELDAQSGVRAILQTSMTSAMLPFVALNRQLLTIGSLSLVISLIGALLLARGVTRPVQQLADAAKRIGQGDYLGDVANGRQDEFGELARSFDTMQRGIAEREQRITHLAYHDALTGLPNRINLEQQIAKAVTLAHGGVEQLAVLMIGVNRFKEINDTLGHPIGDRLLVSLGQRLRAATSISDTVGRLGGDEFVVVLRGADANAAAKLASGIIEEVTKPIALDTMELYPDVSIGIAVYPMHGHTAEDLLRRADIAMHDAKNGDVGLSVYAVGRDALYLRRLSLIGDLRRAAEHGELVVHYQPKLSLGNDRIEHVEALVRWQHPTRGFIQPDEFIPLAEHSGSIRLITEWMLRTVISQCRAWSDQGHDVGIAINISAIDLSSGKLPSTVRRLLSEAGVDAGRLVLEITESAVMRDATQSLEMLRELKACGVRLAIDDFGTGQSSLSHLKRMPVDEIKIDKSFVMGMADDSGDAVIVRSTIELGHNMGLSVVAEGVENARALRMLSEYDCDMAQGFLISRPIAEPEMTALLTQAKRTAGVRAALEST